MNIMHNQMIHKEKAIGYTRVSTILQADRDDSPQRQAACIKQAASEQNWELLGIYEEVGSAVGRDSLHARPELKDALRLAEREGAIIIVTEPTRLFRNRQFGLETLRGSGVRVFSIKHQGVLSRRQLGDSFYAGQERAEVTRNATSKAKAKSAHNLRPSKTATDNSRKSRKLKSEEVAEQLADILEEDLSIERLSHREFAELLNARGVRSGWGRRWNAQSVRDRRKRAMEIFRERHELADESDGFDPMVATPLENSTVESPSQRSTKKSRRVVIPLIGDAPKSNSPSEGEDPQLADTLSEHPLFGLF